MNIKKIKNNLSIILLSYHQIIKKSIYIIISLILVVGSSLLITLPLWYLATEHSKIYTTAVIILFFLLIVASIVLSLKKWVISKKNEGLETSSIILIPVKKIITFILFAAVLYGIILVYTVGQMIAAILLTLSYLLILGYFIFISRKQNG